MSDGVSLCSLQLPQVCWKPQGTNRGRGLIVGLTYSINVMRAWGCVSVGGCVKCGGGGRVWVWGEGGGIFMWVCVGGTYFCSCWLGRDWKPLILKVYIISFWSTLITKSVYSSVLLSEVICYCQVLDFLPPLQTSPPKVSVHRRNAVYTQCALI